MLPEMITFAEAYAYYGLQRLGELSLFGGPSIELKNLFKSIMGRIVLGNAEVPPGKIIGVVLRIDEWEFSHSQVPGSENTIYVITSAVKNQDYPDPQEITLPNRVKMEFLPFDDDSPEKFDATMIAEGLVLFSSAPLERLIDSAGIRFTGKFELLWDECDSKLCGDIVRK